MEMEGNIILLVMRIACFFGWHDWSETTPVDRVFYPQFTEHCLTCGIRRNKHKENNT